MSSMEHIDSPVLATVSRLSALSIVIDDFDCEKSSAGKNRQEGSEVSPCQAPPKPYSRQSSDAMIRKILEEAEHRKNEFWKLIDEHNAVIENLKTIEQMQNSSTSCPYKVSPPSPTASAIHT